MSKTEKRRWRLCVLILTACLASHWLALPVGLDATPVNLEALPFQTGEWNGEDIGALKGETRVLPADATIWRRTYRKPGSEFPVEVSLVITGRHPKLALHQPEICFRAQGWDVLEKDVVDLTVDGYGKNPLRINRLLLQSKGMRAVAYYWFQSQDSASPNRVFSLGSVVRRRLVSGRAERWALIRVMTPLVQDSEENMRELLSGLWPVLLQRWMT